MREIAREEEKRKGKGNVCSVQRTKRATGCTSSSKPRKEYAVDTFSAYQGTTYLQSNLRSRSKGRNGKRRTDAFEHEILYLLTRDSRCKDEKQESMSRLEAFVIVLRRVRVTVESLYFLISYSTRSADMILFL